MERRLFDDLVLSRSGGGTHTRAGAMPFSMVIHAAALTGLLALSMAARDELPAVPERGRIVNYPPGSGGPAPVASTPRRVAARRPTSAPTFSVVPAVVPQPEEFSPGDTPPGDPGPEIGGCIGCTVGRGGTGDGPPEGDPVGTGSGTAPPTPVRPGGDVRVPRKIRNVDPIYPDLARRAGVSGIVILECVIDREGRVRSVNVLRGHPLLQAAAAEAVRQWVYTPTLLNGVPVEVVMTVTVHFTTR